MRFSRSTKLTFECTSVQSSLAIKRHWLGVPGPHASAPPDSRLQLWWYPKITFLGIVPILAQKRVFTKFSIFQNLITRNRACTFHIGDSFGKALDGSSNSGKGLSIALIRKGILSLQKTRKSENKENLKISKNLKNDIFDAQIM